MKVVFTCFFLVLKIVILNAQDLNSNYYKSVNYKPEKDYLNNLCKGYDSIYKSITYREKNENKVMKEALTGTKSVLTSFEKDELLMKNDSITKYLQHIVNQIQQKNTMLNGKKFTVFTYRTSVPNAANYGNGIILFNLNLLAKLDNEGKVAFILCHEMGHDIKEHSIQSIRKNYELITDPEVKKQFEAVKKKEYNQLKSIESFVFDIMSKRTSQSRILEIEADSVGLVLFNNAGYKLSDAYDAINELDSIDNETYTAKINYDTIFSYPDCPFKKSWLLPEEEEETIGGGNMVKVDFPDSLKTHPNCKDRFETMKSIKLAKKSSTHNSNNYSYFRDIAQFEMLEVYLDSYEFSMGLYNAIQLTSKYPNNLYLKCYILNTLYEIHRAKINHYFSLVTDKQDIAFSESYQEMLYFLNNVNVGALKKIIDNYSKANFNTNTKDAYSGYVQTLLMAMDKDKEQKHALVLEYEKNFGKNTYLSKLNNKFIPKK